MAIHDLGEKDEAGRRTVDPLFTIILDVAILEDGIKTNTMIYNPQNEVLAYVLLEGIGKKKIQFEKCFEETIKIW